MTPKAEREHLSDLASHELAQPTYSANTQPEEYDGVIPANDFALVVVDKTKCSMIRASDIFTLEAYGNHTRVHLRCSTSLLRRPLRECELGLDPSLFFRARCDCIVNLGRISQTRMIAKSQLVFVLQDGREIVASREHSLLFRRSREL